MAIFDGKDYYDKQKKDAEKILHEVLDELSTHTDNVKNEVNANGNDGKKSR